MSIKVNKSQILNDLKAHYKIKSDAEFARFLGIKPQTLASWHSRNTFDFDLLYAKCVGLDGNFLFTGINLKFDSGESSSLSVGKNKSPDLTKELFERIIEAKDKIISSKESEIQSQSETILTQKKLIEKFGRSAEMENEMMLIPKHENK